MKPGRVVVEMVILSFVLAACAPTANRTGPPWCDDFPVLMLEAQSVPTASLIPCVDLMPLGWSAEAATINEEGSSFHLNSSIAGSHAAEIRLTGSCDVGGAVAVPTDEDGTERFEDITRLEGGFRGTRYYTFDGGCVAIDLTLDADVSAELLNDVSLAIGFIPRSDLNQAVRDATGGREQLDPVSTG